MLLEFLLFYETQRINLRVLNVHGALKKNVYMFPIKIGSTFPSPLGENVEVGSLSDLCHALNKCQQGGGSPDAHHLGCSSCRDPGVDHLYPALCK